MTRQTRYETYQQEMRRTVQPWYVENRRRVFQRQVTDSANGCKEWTGKLQNGYGSFRATYPNGKVEIYAHRYAWFLANGLTHSGMFICHTCDNRRCVNADHLFLGTQVDNMADMAQKRRHGRYKLQPQDVEDIRAYYQQGGISQSQLAATYGVSQTGISAVIRRQTHRFVA